MPEAPVARPACLVSLPPPMPRSHGGGDAPFGPGEVAGYGEYDQLMRRDEWFGRGEEGA